MEIVKGDYIRKKNYDLFGRKVVLEVNSIKQSKTKKGVIFFLINGRKWVETAHIEKSSKEESENLQNLFESCKITESLRPNLNTSCIREDNGQPKNKIYSERAILRILFMRRMKNPEGGFEAYKCAHCGAFHLGKTINI
jgi:hypothetical protein